MLKFPFSALHFSVKAETEMKNPRNSAETERKFRTALVQITLAVQGPSSYVVEFDEIFGMTTLISTKNKNVVEKLDIRMTLIPSCYLNFPPFA